MPKPNVTSWVGTAAVRLMSDSWPQFFASSWPCPNLRHAKWRCQPPKLAISGSAEPLLLKSKYNATRMTHPAFVVSRSLHSKACYANMMEAVHTPGWSGYNEHNPQGT